MEELLYNPVYNALVTGDKAFNFGNKNVRFFEKEVSPFAGFDDNYENGFKELHTLLPQDRKILFARPQQIQIPKDWKTIVQVSGLQFVLDHYLPQEGFAIEPIPLGPENIAEMIQLTALTKPGPFNQRTIEFGYYYGIFQNKQLLAMTGQRLHVADFTEISAVCTHPDYLGKGFAGALLRHQINLILGMGQIPFLHVRADNRRAIELYERVGFKVTRPMNFYFLQRM